jgi:hypothetical protein
MQCMSELGSAHASRFQHTADLADDFYTGLTDGSAPLVGSRAAAALHAAVQRLRDEHAGPLLRASYVHTGP